MSDSPLTAVIFASGIRSEIGLWKLEGETLLNLAIKIAISSSQIDRILVVSDHPISGDKELHSHPSVTSVTIPFVDSNNDDIYEIMVSIYPYLRRSLGLPPENFLGGLEGGLVAFDPLCPLRRPSHIIKAINMFISQGKQQGRGARRFHVVSVGILQNHFHPFKVFRVGSNGSLNYFSQEGRKIYQRQQLDRHPYFYENSAVSIFNERLVQGANPMGNEVLGCLIEDPMVIIRKKHDIKLAEALNHS